MQNLMEYALGADPLVVDAALFRPTYGSMQDGGTNYLACGLPAPPGPRIMRACLRGGGLSPRCRCRPGEPTG